MQQGVTFIKKWIDHPNYYSFRTKNFDVVQNFEFDSPIIKNIV